LLDSNGAVVHELNVRGWPGAAGEADPFVYSATLQAGIAWNSVATVELSGQRGRLVKYYQSDWVGVGP